MKIVVPVKEVAEVGDEFEIVSGDIPAEYLEYDLNEWDDYAVEEAVQMSEVHDDVEVVTVTIGPERSEETIRMALAKGADRAVRIWDESLEDTEHLAVDAKAEILSALVEGEDPELVLTGVQASDDANGATGVALAEKMDFEWAAVVNDLDVDLESGVASIHRELEGGIEELTDVEIPAVLTIQTGINEPRYASLRGIRQAQRKPLDVRSFSDLGVDPEVADSPLNRTAMYEPESEGDAEVWKGDPEETADDLADFLQEKGVVEG